MFKTLFGINCCHCLYESGSIVRMGVLQKMYALEKCWEIRQCASKENCPAYPHFGRSCWLITGKLRFLSNQKDIPACHRTCESCEVYQWHMALLEKRSLNRGSELITEQSGGTTNSPQDVECCIFPRSDRGQIPRY